MIRILNSLSKDKEVSRLARLLLKAQFSKSVVIMAPMYTADNEKDGYMRRVKTIDETIFEGYTRFYIMGDHPELEQIRLTEFDKEHLYLEFNSANLEQMKYINSLAFRCGRLYVHSVYRFMAGPVSHMMQGILDVTGMRVFWDVHGAVPEECCLNGDPGIAEVAEKIETLLYQKSKAVICVNHAMEDYLRHKHGENEARFVILPIIGINNDDLPRIEPEISNDRKPVVVYSGGLQSWQNIPDMMQLINETSDVYEYRLFVSNPQELIRQFPEIEKKAYVTTLTVEKLEREYNKCQFGLLLRDDIPVNWVSCPTKLIEYLEYGIIPVLKTLNIGDFLKMGMRAVSERDLHRSYVPDYEEQCSMRAQNRRVLDSIRKQQNEGEQEIKSLL